MRRIGETESRTKRQQELLKAIRACKGAPDTIQFGAVVAMAEALESCIQTLGMDFENPHDAMADIEQARAALAMYYGEVK